MGGSLGRGRDEMDGWMDGWMEGGREGGRGMRRRHWQSVVGADRPAPTAAPAACGGLGPAHIRVPRAGSALVQAHCPHAFSPIASADDPHAPHSILRPYQLRQLFNYLDIRNRLEQQILSLYQGHALVCCVCRCANFRL